MRWVPVIGFEDSYIVSNSGLVASMRGLLRGGDVHGYRHMTLGGRGGPQKYVHQIVMESFNGPCPDGLEVHHKNRDRSDNRLENLEWVTRRKNLSERKLRTKLTIEQAYEIKSSSLPTCDLVDKFGVSRGTVKNIRAGRTWGNI